MRRPAPARDVRDAMLLGVQRAFIRGAVIAAAATLAGISWHPPHDAADRRFDAVVVETCPCPAPTPEAVPSWLLSSR